MSTETGEKSNTDQSETTDSGRLHKIVMYDGWRKYFTLVFWKFAWMRIVSGQRPLNIISTFEIEGRDAEDAKRYRWLRKQHWSDGGMAVLANASDAKLNSDCPSGERLDNMIDEKLNT
jgi:hypothetical protein